MNRQRGFTIIELLIATMVFSVLLLVLMTAVLQIGRIYYKGVTNSRTQEAARTVVDDISQAIQFSGGQIQTADDGAGNKSICIGTRRYSYRLDNQISSSDPSKRALVADRVTTGTCTVGIANPDATELLGDKMRLVTLNVDEVPAGSGLWKVKVRVAYGDNDLLEDKLDAAGNPASPGDGFPDSCKAGQAGTQFCAVSELNTQVQKRL